MRQSHLNAGRLRRRRRSPKTAATTSTIAGPSPSATSISGGRPCGVAGSGLLNGAGATARVDVGDGAGCVATATCVGDGVCAGQGTDANAGASSISHCINSISPSV
jgi:hypothetical protein